MDTQYINWIVKTTIPCCAMCQISNVNNKTPVSDIQDVLDALTVQKEQNKEVYYTTGNGQTSVFCIVSPGEDNLEINLISLGFKNKHEFERRVGYPKTGNLKMYIKNL